MEADPVMRRAPGNSYSYLLFLALMFFLMNGGPNDPTYQKSLQAAINRRVLQRARFADYLHGNHTAEVQIPYPTDPEDAKVEDAARLAEANRTFALPDMHESLIDHLVEPLMSSQLGRAVYHRNITGFLKGEWNPSTVILPEPPVVDPPVNETELEATERERMSWKSQRGLLPWLDETKDARKVSFNVREVKEAQMEPHLAILRGNLEFEAKGYSARLDVEGLHFLDTGQVYIIARPEELLIDIRELPALLRNAAEVDRAAHAVLHELDVRIGKMQEALRSGVTPSGNADFTSDIASNCTFAIYGKLSPERRLSSSEMAEWEANLEEPTGSSVAEPDVASLDAVAHSANCGLVLEIKDAKSLLMDRFWSKALSYSAAFAVIALVQVVLLVSQMESTSTAATLVRVSYWTISLQVGMDAYAFVTHLTLGVVTDNRSSVPLLLPSFLLCLSSLLFGLRYAASIRVAVAPSRSATPAPAAPAQAAATAAQQPAGDQAPPTGVQITVVATNTSTGIWGEDSPIWLAIPLGAIFSFVILLAIFGWLVLTTVGLYSYWIPQIYANAERDASRRTLQKRYIIGTALCRLFLPLYIWACPDNVLFAQSSRWVYALVAYQGLQVAILLLQDYLGPRFFLPKGIYPPRERWNYHPILPPSDVEASGGKGQDCIICLEPIELPTQEESESLSSHVGPLSRWTYMVPPCHHIAHTGCLESWLAVKSECVSTALATIVMVGWRKLLAGKSCQEMMKEQ